MSLNPPFIRSGAQSQIICLKGKQTICLTLYYCVGSIFAVYCLLTADYKFTYIHPLLEQGRLKPTRRNSA